jgi:pectate lyase
MLSTSDAPFGFGQAVTGGGDVAPTSVQDSAGLAAALSTLGDSDGPKTIELVEGSYDFKGQNTQVFTIRARNLTIRAQTGKRVKLKNFKLVVDLARADNILIQDLAFRSDGAQDSARDAINLNVVGSDRPSPSAPPDVRSNVRITHCSFDGYYDIAIDSHTQFGRPRLLATIDHCLFFDSMAGKNPPPPGQAPPDPKKGPFLFVNRGAINISGLTEAGEDHTQGSSYVTVAFNVFVEVWRRTPRVAQGTVAHIFNNLLFRWGFGNNSDRVDAQDPERKTSSWIGINVETGASAVIQANRFIPWDSKPDLNKAIKVDQDNGRTIADIGTRNFPNEFDNAQGMAGSAQPPGPFSQINIGSYLGQEPEVTLVGQVPWASIVNSAGPRLSPGVSDPKETAARQEVFTVIGTA